MPKILICTTCNNTIPGHNLRCGMKKVWEKIEFTVIIDKNLENQTCTLCYALNVNCYEGNITEKNYEKLRMKLYNNQRDKVMQDSQTIITAIGELFSHV